MWLIKSCEVNSSSSSKLWFSTLFITSANWFVHSSFTKAAGRCAATQCISSWLVYVMQLLLRLCIHLQRTSSHLLTGRSSERNLAFPKHESKCLDWTPICPLEYLCMSAKALNSNCKVLIYKTFWVTLGTCKCVLKSRYICKITSLIHTLVAA